MPSLTHVCMWSKHGWKRVTASEATRFHPGGTVSARSGLFMCELCGQYVTLTDGEIRERYFKHSAEELSKDCPDRTFSQSVSTTFQAGAHDLPLRLKIFLPSRDSEPSWDFELQLGFLPVENSLLENQENRNRKIIVSAPNNGTERELYKYSFERIQKDTTTYLPVGNIPYEQYNITLVPTDGRFTSFWPKSIEGVSRNGALFDGSTGKKLPCDADTTIGQKYYLLTPFTFDRRYPGITVTEKSRRMIHYSTWYVYEIIATSFEESTARFFLDYHCRLTENAVDITPLWPACVETPYRLCHCSDQITFFLRGDAEPKVFPKASLHWDSVEKGKVVTVNCKERQQLLSAGRTKVLKYTYLWKDNLDRQSSLPQIWVTDLSDTAIHPGEYTKLPQRKAITIKAPFDGYVLRTKNGTVLERYALPAGKTIQVDHIRIGQSIEVFQGMDLVWDVHYDLSDNNNKTADDELISKLENCKDENIAVPHSLGALSIRMNAYPKTKDWLYTCIRNGKMPQKAYKLVVHHFTSR